MLDEEQKQKIFELFEDLSDSGSLVLNGPQLGDHLRRFQNISFSEIIDTLKTLKALLSQEDYLKYLLHFNLAKPPGSILSRDEYTECLFNYGTLLKQIVDNSDLKRGVLSSSGKKLLQASLVLFHKILQVSFDNQSAIIQIVSVYSVLTVFDPENRDSYLSTCMLIAPENPTVHYNQAFVLAGTNRLEIALVHYKLALTLNEAYLNFEKASVEAQDLLLNTYNGLANLFRGVKQWPQSLFYLSQAIKYRPKDPDINNQLGTVYTELRRTDLAEACYQLAIDNINQACISKNQSKLLADIYLNYGHLFSYNGDNYGAIESYNTSLKYHPGYILPFQNKIMNLNYISDYLESGYISQQHRLVERLFSPPKSKFSRTPQSFLNQKIRIGLVSGDFVEHPVSFFISTFLKYHDSEKYQVICYTNTAMTSTLADQTKATFKNSEGLSAELLADLIYNDKILILFDLAGHTAHNRLDVFALKPAPIQVSYIGYPFTTGLSQMDYRITDTVCEGGEMDISQKDYTEQLITMPGCFLSYDPTVKVLPEIRDDNNFDQRIAFGCFNRLNKITPDVIKLCEQVLQVTENSIFYFKTKALLNDSIKEKFLSQFSSDVRDRIKVLECTLSHEQHLSEYNKVDYAIDTFPYSGTTTSCEALAMGVPVFTLLRPGCHASNVTASILKYTSNELFERYTASDCETLLKKVGMMTASRKTGDRLTYKKQLRDTFLKGSVCDGPGFVVKFQNLLESLLLKYSA